MSKRMLTIRVTPEEYYEFQMVALRQKKSMNELAVELIYRAIEEEFGEKRVDEPKERVA